MEKDHLEILLEDIRGKFELVLEGHDALHEDIRDTRKELLEKISFVDFKVETLNEKIDGVRDELGREIKGVRTELCQEIKGVRKELGQKIDAVAADLAAHRADTEVHKKVYKVKEG